MGIVIIKSARISHLACILLLIFVQILCLECPHTEYIPTNEGLIPNAPAKWTCFLLRENVNANVLKSPIEMARALSTLHSCLYNTWSIFHEEAISYVPTRTGKMKAVQKQTIKAMGYSGWKALRSIFSESPSSLENADVMLKNMGFEAIMSLSELDEFALAGIESCEVVLEAKENDGYEGPRWSKGDSSGYFSINDPQKKPGVVGCEDLRSLSHWQPELNVNKNGALSGQVFASAQSITTRSFSDFSIPTLPIGRPPIIGSEYRDDAIRQYEEVFKISGQLDDIKKTIADYWYSPVSEGFPPGKWTSIALGFVQESQMNLEAMIKLMFIHSNALFDAGLAAWALKRVYQNARPISVIQCLFSNHSANMWSGPYQGVGTGFGRDWKPFLPSPPFPDYVSGHSTFSGASSHILSLFSGGNDTFIGKNYYVQEPGASTIEPRIEDKHQLGYVAGVTDFANKGADTKGFSPASKVRLEWKTYTEAAEQAGMSRMYAGIHTYSANIDGLYLGRYIAKLVWMKSSSLFRSPPNNLYKAECDINGTMPCSNHGFCNQGTCICRPEFTGWRCSQAVKVTQFFIQDFRFILNGDSMRATSRICAKDSLLGSYAVSGVYVTTEIESPLNGTFRNVVLSDNRGVVKYQQSISSYPKGNYRFCFIDARKVGYVWISTTRDALRICTSFAIA